LLAGYLKACGWDPIVLTRSPSPNGAVKEIVWDARTLGDWAQSLDGAEAIINLAGRSVNCRYNAENRRAIMDSRVDSTRVIGEAIARCANPPRVWLNSSTATI
jgi:NAD dependent epimerase/dehydratase family enzyme